MVIGLTVVELSSFSNATSEYHSRFPEVQLPSNSVDAPSHNVVSDAETLGAFGTAVTLIIRDSLVLRQLFA